jgi:type IV secretion system protein VirB11
MISTQQIQERRRDELLRRQLGPRLLAAMADPAITDIIINEDGRTWFEAHSKGLFEAGFSISASQIESLIGTVAAALGTVTDADHPIVEGELPIERMRFEGLMPPVVRRPCFAMRKPAQVLYTLTDYVRDRIVTESQTGIFREAIVRRENILISGGTGSGKDHAGRCADQRNGRALGS